MKVLLKPPQWKVFRCAERFRVLVAGRRFGKTYLALMRQPKSRRWEPPDMGRPRFNPTAEQYRMVKSLAAYGMRQSEIAAMLELRSEKTLRKHFRSALDRGAAEANSQVAQSLYRLATSGKSAAAAIFWLKCRAGWREQKEFDRSTIPPPPFVVGAVKENQ